MRKLLLSTVSFAPVAAFAQDATADVSAGSPYASFLPLLFIFAVFYFLLIRPQQKKMKEHQGMLTTLQKGDEIVTAGGILGKITKVDGDNFIVEIAKGVEVKVLRSTVSAAIGKEAPKTIVTDKKKANTRNDNTVVSRENVANDN